MPFSAVGVGAVTAGGLLVYAGIKGYSVPQVLQNVITGQPPGTGQQAYPITQTTSSSGGSPPPPGSGAGARLASVMQGYVGHVPYVWGGGSPNGWDCSGAVNYCANHDCKLPIPGYKPGTFDGTAHGPPTMMWLAWAPANLEHVPAGSVQAGDLVIWQTHMGVAVSATKYVSAYDTALGTVVEPIHGGGPTGEVATYWRYK